MVENEEKIVPEADEKKAEAASETKAKEEKAAPKKSKTGLIALIAVVGVVVIAAIVFCVIMFVNGSNAVSAWQNKDYAAAYETSKSALFMSAADKNTIAKDYALSLAEKGDYYKASAILNESGLSEDEKKAITAKDEGFNFAIEGSVVNFAKYDQDGDFTTEEDVKWVVLEVKVENGKAKALLMARDILGFDTGNGWNRGTDSKNSKYSASNVSAWCDKDFYSSLKSSLRNSNIDVLKTDVVTTVGEETDTASVSCFVLSKAEVEQYLTGDFAKYMKAKATATAQTAGALVDAEGYGTYFLRDIGKKATDVCAVNTKGELVDNASKTNYTLLAGMRPCLWVDLGTV